MSFLAIGEKDNLLKFMSKLFDVNVCYRAFSINKAYKFENVKGDLEIIKELASKSGVIIQK